jgi:hypothetical protein
MYSKKQNAQPSREVEDARGEMAQKRVGDTPTGALACPSPSQDPKGPPWAVIR